MELIEKLFRRKKEKNQTQTNLDRALELFNSVVDKRKRYWLWGEEIKWVDWESYAHYKNMVDDGINIQVWEQFLRHSADKRFLIEDYRLERYLRRGEEAWSLGKKELLPSLRPVEDEFGEKRQTRYYFPSLKDAKSYREECPHTTRGMKKPVLRK